MIDGRYRSVLYTADTPRLSFDPHRLKSLFIRKSCACAAMAFPTRKARCFGIEKKYRGVVYKRRARLH